MTTKNNHNFRRQLFHPRGRRRPRDLALRQQSRLLSCVNSDVAVQLLLSSLLFVCVLILIYLPAAHARSVISARRPSHSGNYLRNSSETRGGRRLCSRSCEGVLRVDGKNRRNCNNQQGLIGGLRTG